MRPKGRDDEHVAERSAERGLNPLATAAARPPSSSAGTRNGRSGNSLASGACRTPNLAAVRNRFLALISALRLAWTAEWVPRNQNSEARGLTVEAWVAKSDRPFPERPAWHKKRKCGARTARSHHVTEPRRPDR